MSEIQEETNGSFETLNIQRGENVRGEGGRIKAIKKNQLLISTSQRIPDENYSIENKENDSVNIDTMNTIEVVDDVFDFKREPLVMQESESPNILLQEHSKDYTGSLTELRPNAFKLLNDQLSSRQSENAIVSKCSRYSYAQVLKSNISSKSTLNKKIEVDYCLKNVLVKNSRLNNEEVTYRVSDYENPFGIIGRNVDGIKPKKLSELQTDFLCNLSEENALIEDAFSHISFKIDLPAVDIKLPNYFDKETKDSSPFENCFWNKFSVEDNLRQKYSHKNMFNEIEFGVFSKATDSHIPKLLDSSNKTYIDQCVNSSNALLKTLNFSCPLNVNQNGDSSSGTCIETLEKETSNSDKNTKTDSSLEHYSSCTSLSEVIPNESVKVLPVSNILKFCDKHLKSERPVLFIPLDRVLKQDAQETSLITSPTHIAIERELSELWKEYSQKSVHKGSKNASHPECQESGDENTQSAQRTMEDSQFCKEVQQFLNGSAEASTMSNSSTVVKSCSSLITEKMFNYTDVTYHPSEHVSEACGQIINDRLPGMNNNLESILDEASDILFDYDSSYDFYKSAPNEVHQEIEEINERISILSEVLNL